MKKDVAVAKAIENKRVIQAIRTADTFADRKIKIGIKSSAFDATAIVILIKVPIRSAEWYRTWGLAVFSRSVDEEKRRFRGFSVDFQKRNIKFKI